MTGYVSTRYYRAPEIMLTWQKYDVAVDIWSAGCIFAEMVMRGHPLFPGDSEIDQIFKIFRSVSDLVLALHHVTLESDCYFTRVLGTPNEESWPGVSQLPDYKPTFPHWSPQDLSDHVPMLNNDGLALLKVCSVIPPQNLRSGF